MNINEAMTTIVIILIVGSITSFLIRVLREGLPSKYFFKTLQLSLEFLVIFPFILFPFLIYKHKNEVSVLIAKEILNKEGKNTRYTKKEIEKQVLCNFTVLFILRLWGCILSSIFNDFDQYVNENMGLVRMIIAFEKKREKEKEKTHYPYRLNFQKNIFNFVNVEKLERVSCLA